jgi:hypothetical protein
VGSGIAARIVDRLPQGRLLVGVELGRAAGIAVALAGIALGSMPLVVAAITFAGLLAAVSTVAAPSLVPALVDDDELPAANGVVGSRRSWR